MKLKIKYSSLKDVITIILIVFSTFFYFVLSYIPEGITTIDLYLFELGTFGFPDIAHLVYYTKMKLLIIVFALIWYFTCKHWWKSALLIIIIIEMSKLITALDANQFAVDEVDYITSLPITLPIIFLVVIISNKLNAYNLSIDLKSKIDEEIDATFFYINGENNSDLIKLEEKYKDVKKRKSSFDARNYLNKLIILRNEFYQI